MNRRRFFGRCAACIAGIPLIGRTVPKRWQPGDPVVIGEYGGYVVPAEFAEQIEKMAGRGVVTHNTLSEVK